MMAGNPFTDKLLFRLELLRGLRPPSAACGVRGLKDVEYIQEVLNKNFELRTRLEEKKEGQ